MILKKYRHTKNREDKLHRYFSILCALIFFGCGPSVYYEIPYELRDQKNRNDFLIKYTPYISGKVIFLDPGHGGADRKNKGYQDLAVEADVNLKVALHLKTLLESAGAKIIMSRVTDATVELNKRSELANNSLADIFISIHHNAPAMEGDNWTDYTSTYYHGFDTDYVYEPSERDIARYIQRDLSYAMRNAGGPGSFDGTYSDYAIYPGEGFAVLRNTVIPAVLVECGFHTNTHEEQRIVIDEFNRIEAWGIFRGLCRYFYAGVPEIKLTEPLLPVEEGNIKCEFRLYDSTGIDSASIKVFFDSLNVNNYSYENGLLLAEIDSVHSGSHSIRVIAANKNGNHTFPFQKEITVFNRQE